eukprot:2383287-Pyramimonas_sp.AAC.1
MFQNGQDCPGAFGYEPVQKILRSRDMSDEDKLLNLVKDATALVQLAKGVSMSQLSVAIARGVRRRSTRTARTILPCHMANGTAL